MKSESKTEKSISEINNQDIILTADNPKYQTFNAFFFGAILTTLLGVGSLNLVINPYGIFTIPKIQGLTQDRPRQKDNDRLFKATDIIHLRPKTVVIGSSRVRQGIAPNHPALVTQPTYNLGLNGVNVYEQLRYLRHAIANQNDLKVVVLEIDLFMFNQFNGNQAAFDSDRLEKNHLILNDIINATLSWSAIEASYETVISSFQNRQNLKSADFGKNGFFPYRNIKKEQTEARFKASINQYLELHHQYQLSKEYMADFKQLVELCRQKGIDLKVFISPAHATQGEVIQMTGYWQIYEDWKRQIVNITPVWDFSGYNSVTTAKINPEMENYSDNSHYMPFIGAFVLDRLFSYQTHQVPQDFGVWLTPNSVEAHIKNTRIEREQWINQNPEAVKLVQKVKREFDQHQRSAK